MMSSSEDQPAAAISEAAILGRAPGAQTLAKTLARMGFRPRLIVILIPYLWLLLFFLIPFAIVLKISFALAAIAQPPYTPMFGPGSLPFDEIWQNYQRLLDDALYFRAYLNSVWTATVSTVLCLLIGYPMAYGIARSSPTVRNALMMLIVLPFWTSFLIRVYAWIGILKNNGIINNILLSTGIIDQPIAMMNTNFAVFVGIVYSYLPFMILPLYANLEKMDLTLLEAAADLGCRPLKAFFVITVPLSFPGIIAGSMLVFIPAVGEYVIPELLGGPSSLMIGRVLVNEFSQNRDWPVASAVAIAVLVLLVVPLGIYQYYQSKEAEAGK